MYRFPRYNIIEDELQKFQKMLAIEEDSLPREIRDILHCVHEHLFEQDLNVNLVKERCRVRNNNITIHFRFKMGIGLREYIEEKRLLAARELLKHGDIEIYMIAMSVGYAHPESFNRAFKRHMGCSPSEYKLQRVLTGLHELTPAAVDVEEAAACCIGACAVGEPQPGGRDHLRAEAPNSPIS
jgi:AraC-like DNA-binding protein